ncbi:MAG: alpha-ketoglutarate-dependent dioxygenase AlkB [Phototrophicaceae bacterium]
MLPDLTYIPNYIDTSTELELINTIDKQIWLSPLKRRVQHYGYIYDYKKRTITEDMFIGALPIWLEELAEKLYLDKHIDVIPDQVIINEYIAGQGIARHVDCEPCFGDTILSLSLGSHCIMDFYALASNAIYHQILEPCSLVVMKKEARYQWKHGIKARKSDKIDGSAIKRHRRLSLTFRKVIEVF